MKKLFKKLGLALTATALAVTTVVGLTACGGESKTQMTALAFEGMDAEDYAFCVKKGNAELKAQLDEFFAEQSTKDAINVSLNYHTGASETTIDYPTLSDNKGKTITMVTEAGFAPYEFTKTEGKGVVNGVGGVDVDMMMLFCEKFDYKLDLLDVEFKAIPEEVNKSNDRIGAAGMTITEERKLVVDFAVPYIKTKQFIISKKGVDCSTMDSLKGKKIGCQESTTGDFIVGDAVAAVGSTESATGELAGSGATHNSYKKVSVAFQDLINGKLDAIVIDEFVAKGLVANYNA